MTGMGSKGIGKVEEKEERGRRIARAVAFAHAKPRSQGSPRPARGSTQSDEGLEVDTSATSQFGEADGPNLDKKKHEKPERGGRKRKSWVGPPIPTTNLDPEVWIMKGYYTYLACH